MPKPLAQRVPMPADGRLVLVQITDAGRDLMFRLFPQVNAAEVYAVSPLKPGEVGDLAATLRQILTHLEGARTAQA